MAKKSDRGGLKIPVPGPNELRPNASDAEPRRGALAYATPYRSVMKFGGPDGVSPARPDFTPGQPAHVASKPPTSVWTPPIRT